MRGTLSFRIGVILVAGFVLLQLLQFLTLLWPGRIDDRDDYGLPPPPAFAELVRSVEAAGPQGARRLIGAFDGALFTLAIQPAAPRDFHEVPREMKPLAIAYRRALPDHNMVVDGGPGRLHGLLGGGARPLRFLVPIRLTVWLRGGDVLVLTGRPADGLRAYLARRSRIGLVGGAVLLVLLWLALRQTTRPLRRLTDAVRALGDDLTAGDVPPEGSGETRTLAVAFNEMKARIAALVAERTFMLAGIAHDLRTGLTRLRLRAEFIADDDQRTRAIADLDQMAALLDDGLLFARIGHAGDDRREAVDLAERTRALTARHPGHARIVLALPAACAVRADPLALDRIFANLVDNGLRHASTVTIALAPRGGDAVWTFTDDGPGVAPDDLPRLGGAFVRLDASRDRRTGGTGLGLAIVRALVAAMGGTVTFRSAPGEGLTIAIALPSGEQAGV